MLFKKIPKRPLKNVSDEIWNAVSLMEHHYGAVLTHDSGHDKKSNEKATTWIFNFPKFGDAQIAVPMNQDKFSFLLRQRTLDGQSLSEIPEELGKVTKTYVNSKKGVTSSILGPRAPFLNPSSSNPVLRVAPNSEQLDALLMRYLAITPISKLTTDSTGSVSGDGSVGGASAAEGALDAIVQPKGARAVTADELQRQLDRNSETGRAGELIAVMDELERLRITLCPTPETFVERVALTNVGCGFDIASTWPGEERCIEVKSTTAAGSDFFMTENECVVLSALGTKAWLYRVVIGPDGSGQVTSRLQNPMEQIAAEHKTPAVWRVSGKALET